METPQSSHRSRRSSIGVEDAPFQSPLMSFEHIIADIQKLGYDAIEVADLEEARKVEKIKSLYAFLLEICAGINEELLEQRATALQLKCGAEYEFAHVLHTTFHDFVFYLELRDVIAAAGYDKFSLRDIHSPESKRLRHILSSLMNYCKYREQQIPVYARLHEDRNILIETYQRLQEEKHVLMEQREIALYESKERTVEIEDLAKHCEEMEQIYLEMNTQQSNDRNLATEARKDSVVIGDKIETAKWEVENIVETFEVLENTKLAKSPERKIKVCQERKEALDKVKKDHAALCEEIETLSTVTHRASQYKAPLMELQALASQVVHLQNQVHIAKAEEPKIQANLRAVQEQIDETENVLEREERELARLQYQLEHDTDVEFDEDELRRQRTEALAKEAYAEQRVLALKAQYETQMAEQQAEREALDKFHETLQQQFMEKVNAKLSNLLVVE